MKTILLTLVSVLAASAQTAPRPEQIRAPAADAPRVYLFLPSGQAVVAVLDASLVLDTSGPVPILRAVAPAAAIREAVEVTKAASPITGIVLANNPTSKPAVYWNGLLMAPGEDYTHASFTRQITLLRPALVGDVIQVIYRF